MNLPFPIKISSLNYINFLISTNQYGHLHKETIQKLAKNNVTVLRTDELGTITITSDGENINTNAVSAPKTEKTSEEVETNISKDDGNEIVDTEKATNDNSEKLYIGNINTKVYHSQDCGSFPMEKNRVYLTELQAVNKGFRLSINFILSSNLKRCRLLIRRTNSSTLL